MFRFIIAYKKNKNFRFLGFSKIRRGENFVQKMPVFFFRGQKCPKKCTFRGFWDPPGRRILPQKRAVSAHKSRFPPRIWGGPPRGNSGKKVVKKCPKSVQISGISTLFCQKMHVFRLFLQKKTKKNFRVYPSNHCIFKKKVANFPKKNRFFPKFSRRELFGDFRGFSGKFTPFPFGKRCNFLAILSKNRQKTVENCKKKYFFFNSCSAARS